MRSLAIFSLGIFFAAASFGQAPAPETAQTNGQDVANQLVVSVGRSVLVDAAHPVQRVAVGSSDVAEATAVSPTEVMVNGKAAGETSLIIWQADGVRQFFDLQVRPSNGATNEELDGVRRELRLELVGQPVQVTTDNGLVFLRGTVNDLNSADRAVKIASTAGKVVNLLYVVVPPADPQILLKVKFASVDRSLERQLGLNVFTTGTNNFVGSVTTQQFSPPTISGGAGTPITATLPSLLNGYIFSLNNNIGATIQALQTQGLVEVLAEPNLLAANGRQGSFLAGGEFPYAVLQGSSVGGTGAVTIQFREFGVRLNFIPTITPRGTIRLQVAPEVSSLDFANGVTLQGFTIPALATRKVNTEVELKQGQSFVIGGLLDNRENTTFSKIPFIGDIPVLGKFFQSQQKTRNNTELIVVVTPELVDPIPAGAPLPSLKYPDKFLPANTDAPMSNPVPANSSALLGTPPKAIPIEKLLDSMKPEQPLNTNSMTPGAIYTPPPSSGLGTAAPASTNPQ